jgi:hypothetical protein
VIDFKKLKERSASVGDKMLILGFVATFFNQFDGISAIAGGITILLSIVLILYSVKK